jgi:hypothetical protein
MRDRLIGVFLGAAVVGAVFVFTADRILRGGE